MASRCGVIDTWVKAYNGHNVEALMACYDEGVTNTQHPWQKTVTGLDAMRAVYGRTFKAFPDISLRVRELIADGDRVVLLWEFRGTMVGEFAGFQPTHKRFELSGCEVFRLRNDVISEQQGYWDKETMFKQLAIGR